MSNAETEAKLEEMCEDAAANIGGSFQTAKDADGNWVASIEEDDQAIRGYGPTKAMAMGDLLKKT